MHYCFIGENSGEKQQALSDARDKILTGADARNFDYEALYGRRLDAAELKKALIALPASSPKRLILIHEADKLSKQNEEILTAFLEEKNDHAVVILEAEGKLKSAFQKKISPYVKSFSFEKPEGGNVWDMTNAMGRRQPAKALKILSELMEDGQHPLQIMGGLVWFWGKNGQRLRQDRFEKGLLALQEADVNIKRSRMRPDYTMEVLVVRLCALMN